MRFAALIGRWFGDSESLRERLTDREYAHADEIALKNEQIAERDRHITHLEYVYDGQVKAKDGQIQQLQADRDYWRQLALDSIAYQRDENNRLLLKNGVMPTPDRTAPSVTSPPPAGFTDQRQWELEDERAEIEEKAREAASNPALAAYYTEAALYDPAFAPVAERIKELTRR